MVVYIVVWERNEQSGISAVFSNLDAAEEWKQLMLVDNEHKNIYTIVRYHVHDGTERPE